MPDVKQHFNQHRQHGLAPMQPITKTDRKLHNALIAALIIVVILYGYGIAASWDAQAEATDRIIDAQLKFAAERGELSRQASQQAARAYAQGQRDAMRGMTERQGLEFAQACRAYQLREIDSDYPRPSVATTKKGA